MKGSIKLLLDKGPRVCVRTRTHWATTGHDIAQKGKQAIHPSPAPGSNAFGGAAEGGVT